jgi:hypothetical protein
VNIDPIKYARIEFHYGFYRNTREQSFSSYPSYRVIKMTNRSSIAGIGIFGTYPANQVRFILGARYSINNYSEDDIRFDMYGTPSVITNKGKIGILSGVLGGEYIFAKKFSIGAEFSLINMTDTYTPAERSIPETTDETVVTESSLVFRFFPF